MINFIKIPCLPRGRVKHCLIGGKYTDEIRELSELGVECIPLKANPSLDDEVNSHADMLSFNCGNGEIILNKDEAGESDLQKIGILPKLYSGKITSPYPKDIPLNVAYTGRHIICNEPNTAKEILNFACRSNIQIINTRQGYTKCNMCVVSENAVITEDCGLASLLNNYQYTVLLISSGDIYLSDKHYGFLGGASCRISADKMYFSGDLSAHRDYESIVNFLKMYNIEPVFNKFRKLTDFGGIIQLTEETDDF